MPARSSPASRSSGTASPRQFAADVVVLACGAANTAKLLFLSAGDRHPNGLANASDQVGPELHVPREPGGAGALEGREPDRLPEDARPQRLLFRRPESDYPLGNIQMVGKSQAPMFRGERPAETRLAPEWTLEKVAKHAVDFWLSTEDLPVPENRVTVDRDGRVTLAYKATNDVPKEDLYRKLHSMLGALGMHDHHLLHRFAYMKNDIPVAGCAHQAGTARMGADPADLGRRRRLQGSRARQPLRRRHERLPEHRGGQSGPDRDGQLATGGRPPARPSGGGTTVKAAARVNGRPRGSPWRVTKGLAYSSSAEDSPGSALRRS